MTVEGEFNVRGGISRGPRELRGAARQGPAAPPLKALTFLARRFVAGETPETAIAAGRALHAARHPATFDLLGEDVLDRGGPPQRASATRTSCALIPPEVERNISIKLTHDGPRHLARLLPGADGGLLDVAREVGGFVRIDMEGSKHTQRTLDVFRELRARPTTTWASCCRPTSTAPRTT